MDRKPRLLDLFCGAGGAAMGYHRAGFEVVGIDINPQPHFPFKFVQATWDEISFEGFDVVHASPPCQRYSVASQCRPGLSETYPDLIEPVRQKLIKRGVLYVIENVPKAPLLNPIMLCGMMFDLDLFRHRLFESNVALQSLPHDHKGKIGSKAGGSSYKGGWAPGKIISVAGNCAPIAEARRAMDIDWMPRRGLAEAIPPAYTEFIGRQLLERL